MSAHEQAEPAEQFESVAQQAHAARLGMVVFLASEVLFFGALFALFASYKVHYPEAFRIGVAHNTKLLGSLNTLVLLTSGALAFAGVHALREGRARRAGALVMATMLLGLAFLGIKLGEYALHFGEGIYPGGRGRFFTEHGLHGTFGLPEFWSLYYGMTGIHAVHILIGLALLGVVLVEIVRGSLTAQNAHRLGVVALYWHFVDIVWSFLWPVLYLA